MSLSSPRLILAAFLVLSLLRQALESLLGWLNQRYAHDPARQQEAQRLLGLSEEDLQKSLAYAEDRYRFALFGDWIRLGAGLAFIAAGGLGLTERIAIGLLASRGGGTLAVGLLFFAILGLAGDLLSLPFDYYEAFVIEARHGFNRQTKAGFFLDRVKALGLRALLGGIVLAAVLFLLDAGGPWWWLYAWGAVSAFSVLALLLYPRLLAPLFNKFTPLPEGELARDIRALAERIGFRMGGVFVMDASRRTMHGNAYFTGVFREKRIVLFDTLLELLTSTQVLAVLAHELGHFKLHHVRWQLLRSVALTGVTFYLLSLCRGWAPFYAAFGFRGPSAYGALLIFGAWLGLADFLLQPLANVVSRRNEFAADRFAVRSQGSGSDLAHALLRLRERSRVLPLSHPWFSWVYYSHPPLLERLRALGFSGE